MIKEFNILHLFCGSGGGALGFQQASAEWRGIRAKFRTIAGIDCDDEALEDFENLTGARAIKMDLFTREDYIVYDLRETVRDIPDAIFLSPPCKGFSSLLPQKAAAGEKYQALNRLVTRGLFLAMEAWRNNPPGIILLENVPRISSRGKNLLHTVKGLLFSYGYVIHEGFHDCGEVGGLAQHRRRYLLIARQVDKIPNFVYKPPIQRVKSIGEVIGPLPMPDDIKAGGPMHRLPRLQWKTWLRLALIPPGGDWRNLQEITNKEWYSGAYRIIPWLSPSGALIGGASPSCGSMTVADPRLGHRPRKGVFRVANWDKPTGAVIGSASVRGSNGVAAVADPRITHKPRDGAYQVGAWNKPTGPVVGSARVNGSNGVAAITDPRLGTTANGYGHKYQIIKWSEPGCCITGSRFGNGAPAIADVRVTGACDIHAGTAAIADIRIPADKDRLDPPPVIISLDGTWHRPLTTYELAMLQGLPSHMPNGRPLQLAGKSDRRWRERIGNLVPPPAAKGIGNVSLRALLLGRCGAWELSATGIWVVPEFHEQETLLP